MTLSKFLYILTVVYFFFSKQFVINVTVIFKTLCKSLFTIHVTYHELAKYFLLTLYISLGVFKVGFSKKNLNSILDNISIAGITKSIISWCEIISTTLYCKFM